MKQKHKTLHNHNNIKTTKLAKNSGKKSAKFRNITRTSSRKANKQSKTQPKVQKNQSAKTKTNPKPKIKVIINWPEYNKSLARRGDFMYFLTEAIHSGAFFQPLPSHEKGHPKVYKDELILFMLTMREIFNQPLRQTVTAVRSLLLVNGLHYDLPDYTTLCRRAQKLDVEIIPTNYCLYAGDGICYMLDSTGFKVCGAGEWIRKKWGNNEGRTFIESHISINHKDRMILSVINTDCNVHDNTQLLPSLIEANHNLKRARVKQNLEVIIGDGAYDANFGVESKS